MNARTLQFAIVVLWKSSRQRRLGTDCYKCKCELHTVVDRGQIRLTCAGKHTDKYNIATDLKLEIGRSDCGCSEQRNATECNI